jgi:DNA-binding transcriptional LysR family regulator
MTGAKRTPLRNWDAVRAFLAVKDTGSFTAAASYLDSSPPTVSRSVAALEAELGVRLFERKAGLRVTLTPDAWPIVPLAERMETAAADLKAVTQIFRGRQS